MGIGISCMINGLIPIEVKLGFIAVKELKPDVAMEEWSEEEWAWFIVIFLYMISEHLPKAATCSYTLKFHYKLHPVNALSFGEKLVEKMAEIAEGFSMGEMISGGITCFQLILKTPTSYQIPSAAGQAFSPAG